MAVVTGASHGVGRGVALVLGECGVTVYVTGRSVRGQSTQDRPETIEETAELVEARGGVAIPVRVDHRVDGEVEALFRRVQQEQGRLDVLVNNAWGGYENVEGYDQPFWEQPTWRWDAMFDTGARAQFIASRLAVPLMLPQRRGLIVTTGYPDRDTFDHLVWVAKLAINNLTRLMANQLREHQVAALTLAPAGWVWDWQTLQLVYAALKTPDGTEALYRERPDLVGGKHGGGESPEYTGRAVATLAEDATVIEHSGQIVAVDDLARRYAFTDIDGRQPALRY